MKRIFLAATAAAFLVAGPAAAQDACRYWQQQTQAADPQLMAQLAGVWRSQEPNGAGGMAQVTSQLGPDGTMLYDRQTCYSMAGLGTSCPQSTGHGWWVAHMSGPNQIFLATNLTTSLVNGQMTQGCGGGNYVILGPGALGDANGRLVMQRVQ